MLRRAEKASKKHAWQPDKVAVLLKAILAFLTENVTWACL